MCFSFQMLLKHRQVCCRPAEEDNLNPLKMNGYSLAKIPAGVNHSLDY